VLSAALCITFDQLPDFISADTIGKTNSMQYSEDENEIKGMKRMLWHYRDMDMLQGRY